MWTTSTATAAPVPGGVWGTVESDDIRVCAWLPADVPAAWATAAAWTGGPAGLVVGFGGVNGVNVDALAEAPA